jgi:2-polyprenyl-3-methyl-5-hydroxy-6-metoxy-1,4-benzoquinol methylase
MMETFDIKSASTAISRKDWSLPAKWLNENYLITLRLDGDVLDYGCGRGIDADALHADKYDPYWFPNKPSKKYDVVYSIYVLNVLKPEHVQQVIEDIKSYLKPGGKAYLAVRRDIKKEGITSKGTQQWNVVLDLPVVVEKKNKFCIYKLTNE